MLFKFGENNPSVDSSAFVAPSSVLIGNCKIEANASIWFNAVLRGDTELITIGEFSNIQDNSVIHTDPGFPAMVEKHVTVGHSVVFHGSIARSYSLIGMGSTLLNGSIIESNSLVGAGSLVTEGKKFPKNSLIMGSPAKRIRELSDTEIDMIHQSAKNYSKKAESYRLDLHLIK